MSRETIQLNLNTPPADKKDAIEAPAFKPKEETSEAFEQRRSAAEEFLAEDVVEEMFNDTRLFDLHIREVVPYLSDSEREQVVQGLNTGETKKDLKGTIMSLIKKMSITALLTSTMGAGGEIMIKVLARHGIATYLGEAFTPIMIGGIVVGAGFEAIQEYRHERKQYDIDDMITQLRSETDPEQQAAKLAKAKTLFERIREQAPQDKVDELVAVCREAKVLLEKKILEGEISGLDSKMRILYMLKLIGKAGVDIPLDTRSNAETLIKTIEFKTEKGQINRKKIIGAALQGALAGSIGAAAGYGLISFIGPHVEPIIKGFTEKLEALVHFSHEQVTSKTLETLIEGGDKMSEATNRIMAKTRLDQITSYVMSSLQGSRESFTTGEGVSNMASDVMA